MKYVKIIEQQVEAYNARDLNTFASLFSPTIKVFEFNNSDPSIVGLKALRSAYAAVFEDSPALHATVINRISIGNKVIDHEHITGRAGANFIDLVVIYEVKDQLIQRVSYIRANP